MFDIGFFELIIISVIALLVLGPERLPEAARTVGLWVGRIRRTFTSLQSDIERELQVEELKRNLKQQTDYLNKEADSFKNRIQDDLLDSQTNSSETKGEGSTENSDDEHQPVYQPYDEPDEEEVEQQKETLRKLTEASLKDKQAKALSASSPEEQPPKE